MAERPLRKRVLRGVLIFLGINLVYIAFAWFTLPALLNVYIWFPSHPNKEHGTQPAEYLGLWVKDEAGDSSFRRSAFILHDNSRLSDMPTMQYSRWHFDDELLYIDSWSGCGNCLPFGDSENFKVRFEGDSRMFMEPQSDRSRFRNWSGWFKKVTVTPDLITELVEEVKVQNYADTTHARAILFALEDAGRRGLTIDGMDSLEFAWPPRS